MSRKVTKAKGVKQAKSRVREAVFKSSETGKNRRKELRPMKKGYSDKGKEKKEKVYSYLAGACWELYTIIHTSIIVLV